VLRSGAGREVGRPVRKTHGVRYDHVPCAVRPGPDLGGIEAVEPQVRLNHAATEDAHLDWTRWVTSTLNS
jgi:hypothetical protein